MPITVKAGAQVYFAPYASGSSDASNKPDSGSFVYMGLLAEDGITEEPTNEEREIWAASPGRLRRVDVLQTVHEPDFTLRFQQVSPYHLQAIFRTGPLAEGVAQEPSSASSALKGWVSVRYYDQENASYLEIDRFVFLKPQPLEQQGRELLMPTVRCLNILSSQSSIEAQTL